MQNFADYFIWTNKTQAACHIKLNWDVSDWDYIENLEQNKERIYDSAETPIGNNKAKIDATKCSTF